MNELENIIITALAPLGLELWGTQKAQESGRDIFQVFIARAGGTVSLDDCASASRLISPLLDLHDPFPGEYSLEVSSPGLERALKTPEHYRLCVGETLKITLQDKTKLEGRLIEAGADFIVIDVAPLQDAPLAPKASKAKSAGTGAPENAAKQENTSASTTRRINLSEIRKAKTVVQW